MEIDRNDKNAVPQKFDKRMTCEQAEKQRGIQPQSYEFQKLFEEAPCYITVQDRNLKIIRYNREFAERFSPEPGDYCYKAYKGRSERCQICPVLRTFEDGQPHYSEEAAVDKDGVETYWMVKTSPLKNSKGEVIGAMEMSLDLTQVKFLEKEARKSEEKYRTIFNTIPNPVFVLNERSLKILDCNDCVTVVYGFHKDEILMTPFLDLFEPHDREGLEARLRSENVIDRVRQLRRDGKFIYVNIRISSSEFDGRRVLLVTASDITLRLMAEQHLIQAGKMATLGEMATGVAHELNQPLSVIKTASSFLRRKAAGHELISEDILRTMAEEIDNHVDRASKIINHMREFGRKSDVAKEKVQVNTVLRRAVDFFHQQLKLREIDVVEDLYDGLPEILADPNRLEQVFVNLLINARDAIEKKREREGRKSQLKRITLKTALKDEMVAIQVADTGIGIPAAIRDKIFEPFFTTKKVGKGTGLGLSISYGIVHDYDGSIHVESTEGEGTTFNIKFPRIHEA
ncbi:MAG: PAS domain S-box protein [Deltaproteobacteria bacterium]|nr:PAS domain S-box protein [Deltaproteobacteria bacterium]